MSVLTGRYGCRTLSGVGCDTAEELIIRGTEQVGDGRQIFVAVAKPLAATLKTEIQITNKNKKWCGGGGGGSSSSSSSSGSSSSLLFQVTTCALLDYSFTARKRGLCCCPVSVRLSRWWIVSRQLKISSNFFLSQVAHNSRFSTPSADIQFRGEPLTGAQNTRGWKILRFSTEIAVYLGNGTR